MAVVRRRCTQPGRRDGGDLSKQTFPVRRRDWQLRQAESTGTRTGLFPAPRAQAQACYDSINKVMILFGGHANVYPRRTEGRLYTDTWAYDYKTDTWTEMKPAASPSSSAVRFMAFDPVNNVAVNVDGGGAKKQTWVYRYRKAKPLQQRE